MYILIFIFSFSLLGTVFIIGYKVLMLRKYGIEAIPGRITPLSEQAHSLERHLGTFLRTRLRQYLEKSIFWFKTVCVPVVIHATKGVIIMVIHSIRYVRNRFFYGVDSLRNKNTPHDDLPEQGRPQSGASSFFLKDITEHKKNLKNGNGR